MKDFAQFLARFPEVVEERGEYGVLCPAHDDRRPSLFFRLKEDGRVLVRCWAGRARDAILDALGMTAADLFDWTPGDGVKASTKGAPGDLEPGALAALAQYVDTTMLAFMDPERPEARDYVLRRFGLEPDRAVDLGLGLDDRFPYRSLAYEKYARLTVPLNDAGGRPRGLQGRDLTGHCPARWVSLTSPEGAAWAKYGFLRADSGFNTVLVTEGPGDGLTGVAVGYDVVFLRGAGLAGNAALIAELVEVLKGRDVVLAGDRDTAGDQFTNALADALARAGVMVRRLEIPHAGDDLTDWRARAPEAFPGLLHAAVRQAPLHVVDQMPNPAPSRTAEEPAALPLTDLADSRQDYEGGVGISLKPLAAWYVDPTAPDTQAGLTRVFHAHGLTKESGWAQVPYQDETYQRYVGLDVLLTARLRPHLEQELVRHGIPPVLVEFEHRLMAICAALERRGMLIDMPYTEGLVDRLQQTTEHHAERAARYGVTNVNSDRQVAAALQGMGETWEECTGAGAPSVAKEVLLPLADLRPAGSVR